MDPTWIEIIKQLGVPVALLLFVAWKGWPFLMKQIEDAKMERKAEIDKFDNTIKTRDALMVQQWREHLHALDAMTTQIQANTEQVKGLRDEIRTAPRNK